ncbi:MAG: restriction endonuclease subunit S [Verrucomicrobiota bacterium]
MKLPKGWKERQIGDLAIISGGIQKGPHRKASLNPVRYLTVAHVQRNRVLVDDPRFFEVTASELDRWRLEKGDVLIIEGNGSVDQVGRTALFRGEIDNCVHQNHVIRVRPDIAQTSGEYLNSFMNSPLGQAVIQSQSNTTSGLRTLSVGRIREIAVPLPPLTEQRKIADILSTWDEALEKLDALIAVKERRKQALMQQLLTGRKRFPAFGKKAWTKVRMNQVLERVFRPIKWSAGMALSLISIRRRCGGLFRRPDLLGSEYKTQDLHDLKAGDFLVSKRQVAHGAWAMVTPEFAGGHVSKEYAIFVNIAPAKLHMPFFSCLAQTPRMIRLSRVASTGVHIEKLIFDPDIFLRESIRIPADLAEQRQIAAILDTADQELTLLHTQRNALDQQKRGLMQRLLTGKVRVKPN